MRFPSVMLICACLYVLPIHAAPVQGPLLDANPEFSEYSGLTVLDQNSQQQVIAALPGIVESSARLRVGRFYTRFLAIGNRPPERRYGFTTAPEARSPGTIKTGILDIFPKERWSASIYAGPAQATRFATQMGGRAMVVSELQVVD